jgi:hypothetical protein
LTCNRCFSLSGCKVTNIFLSDKLLFENFSYYNILPAWRQVEKPRAFDPRGQSVVDP